MILLVKMAIPRLRSLVEGSLEVKLPTILTDGQAEVGRVREEKRREVKRREEKRRDVTRREEKRREERRSEKRKSQRKEDAGARKVEKSRFTVFFQ